MFEEQTIPCSVLANEDYAILEYRLNLPVSFDFSRQVQANAFVSASVQQQTDENSTTSTHGVSLQLASRTGYPEDVASLFSFLRKGACSDTDVWTLFNSGNWTSLSSSNCTDCPVTLPMMASVPGEYARLYVAVSLEEGATCEGNVSVSVALEDEEDDYKFSSDCLEVDRCFEAPTPAPTWAPPEAPGNTSICDFDPSYAPSNIHSGPLPGKSTYTPLEVACPAVNETVLVWFDIQLPTLPQDTTQTSARISLAVGTGQDFNQTEGISFHGWDVHNEEEPWNRYCILPNFKLQSKREARFKNTWCPPELQSKLCFDERITSESGSIQRIFGEVTNEGGCQGSILFEATLVDGTVNEDIDLNEYEYTSCSSPLAICESGEALPQLPQQTEPPVPEYCMASNETKMFEPLVVDCPAPGELSTVVFDLWYNPELNSSTARSASPVEVLMVLTDMSSNQTEGLEIYFMYDTGSGRFPDTCGNVPFLGGEPSNSIACPPEPHKLCTAMDAVASPGHFIRYYLGILNNGTQCQGQMTIEVAVEDLDSSVECRSELKACAEAPMPTPSPTWYQPPAPQSDVCAFDATHNRYGRSYPNQGLSTYPTMVIPSSCGNGTNANTTKELVWFDFSMPITGSIHHLVATQLEVAVTAMEDDWLEDLIVRIYMVPDYRQQSLFTDSCDEVITTLGDDYETAELDNWLCGEAFEGPATICRSSSYNTYQGSNVRVFVSVFSNTTGHCAGDLKLDATISDISIANTKAPLELYKHSECLQGFTACGQNETFPEMTSWETEVGIGWDEQEETDAPSVMPSMSPSLQQVHLTIPAVTAVPLATDTTLSDTSDLLPQATDAEETIIEESSTWSPNRMIGPAGVLVCLTLLI